MTLERRIKEAKNKDDDKLLHLILEGTEEYKLKFGKAPHPHDKEYFYKRYVYACEYALKKLE